METIQVKQLYIFSFVLIFKVFFYFVGGTVLKYYYLDQISCANRFFIFTMLYRYLQNVLCLAVLLI